jgi:ribosomal protein S18 acetylase RimI-like enzyme
MAMRIREATMKDIEGIQKLYWELDTDAVFYQPSRFVRTERPVGFLIDTINDAKSAILVAEDERKLIGFSLLQEKETPKISCLQEKKYVYVLDIVISEEDRSRGLGSQLLESSKDWGKRRGLDFLRLSVFEENSKGIRFYENNGLTATMRTMECDLC